MPFDLTINGKSYADGQGYEIPWQSLRVSEDPANSQAGCDFDLIIHDNGAGAPAIARPRGGMEVVITNGYAREFAGRVIGPIDEVPYKGMPTVMQYRVPVADYRRYFNRHVLIDEFIAEPAYDRIRRIVDFVNAYGPPFFTMNGVKLSVNPTMPGKRFNGVDPFGALKQIADQLSHAIWLSPDLDLNITTGLSSPSPLPGNVMYPDTSTDGSVSSLHMTDDPSQLITRVYAKGFAVTSKEIVVDRFPSGTVRGQMSREPAPPITKYVTITGGGAPGSSWTIRRETVDGDTSVVNNDYTAYIHQTDRQIRFDPPPSSQVTVTYNPTIRPIWMVEDPVAQDAQKAIDGSDGIFESVLHMPGMSGETLELADARGRMTLAKYGYPKLGGTFNSILQGWRPGQSFRMVSAYRMGGLDMTFYVNQVERTLFAPWGGAPSWRYSITFADRPFLF